MIGKIFGKSETKNEFKLYYFFEALRGSASSGWGWHFPHLTTEDTRTLRQQNSNEYILP
jgi:hypothetical protein